MSCRDALPYVGRTLAPHRHIVPMSFWECGVANPTYDRLPNVLVYHGDFQILYLLIFVNLPSTPTLPLHSSSGVDLPPMRTERQVRPAQLARPRSFYPAGCAHRVSVRR